MIFQVQNIKRPLKCNCFLNISAKPLISFMSHVLDTSCSLITTLTGFWPFDYSQSSTLFINTVEQLKNIHEHNLNNIFVMFWIDICRSGAHLDPCINWNFSKRLIIMINQMVPKTVTN